MMRKTPLTQSEKDMQLQYYRNWHKARSQELRSSGYSVLHRWIKDRDKDDVAMIIKIFDSLSDAQKQIVLKAIISATEYP